MRKRWPLALAVLLAAPPAAVASQTVPYTNDRYGFTVAVPAGWRADPPPDNDDGRTFRSPDDKSFVTAFGHFVLNQDFAGEVEQIQSGHIGETLTFKRAGKDWAVASGTRGDRIFYRRGVISCKNSVWSEVDIEYPAAQKRAFDALVATIAASLKPGVGAYTDDCR